MHVTVAGSLIQLARIKGNISQRHLATRAGTSPAAIASYETGRREPTMPTLLRILRAADFDLRLRLSPHDDHDEVLDQLIQRLPAETREALPERRRTMANRLHKTVT